MRLNKLRLVMLCSFLAIIVSIAFPLTACATPTFTAELLWDGAAQDDDILNIHVVFFNQWNVQVDQVFLEFDEANGDLSWWTITYLPNTNSVRWEMRVNSPFNFLPRPDVGMVNWSGDNLGEFTEQ
jgi:hypothetical protein